MGTNWIVSTGAVRCYQFDTISIWYFTK